MLKRLISSFILPNVLPIIGGVFLLGLIGTGIQTIRLGHSQTRAAKAEGELKWAKEERAAFETSIVDKTATALANGKLAVIRAQRNADRKIKEAQDERDKAIAADIAHVDDRLREGTATFDCSAPAAPGVARYPIMSVGPLQGRLALMDERDIKACTRNARNLDFMIYSWDGLIATLGKPPEQ